MSRGESLTNKQIRTDEWTEKRKQLGFQEL